MKSAEIIEYAKATGTYVDECIECLLPGGRLVNAYPILPFGSYCIPSADWIDKYKDEFFFVLLHNADEYLWIGCAPLWDKLTDKDGFPNTNIIHRSKNFIIITDESEKCLDLYFRSGTGWKRGVSIQEDTVYIGAKSSTEPAALGTKTSDKLETIFEMIGNLASDLIFVASQVPTTTTYATNIKANAIAQKQNVAEVKSGHVEIEI